MAAPSTEVQLDFLTSLQRLLDEGSFTSTYKFALLMAIADLCVEKGDDSGNVMMINLKDIAEKFIIYYWRQALPYPSARQHEVLYQNNDNQAAIINWLSGLHPRYRHSLARAKSNESVWERTVKRVADKIVEMPLEKLQVISGNTHIFLYPHVVTDGQITLLDGVAYVFRRFHGMITRMVQGAWLDEVRRLSKNQHILGQKKDLSEFLFGSDRTDLSAYKPILLETQQGCCFYCQRKVRTSTAVDHFIPWSRYPVDLGHNFVIAHKSCNSSKGDHLAAYAHLIRWIERNTTYGQALAIEFESSGLFHDLVVSNSIAHWAYVQNAHTSGLTWLEKKSLEKLPSNWEHAFR